MKLLGWLQKKRHAASVDKVEARLNEAAVEEVQKHVSALQERAAAVEFKVEKRRMADPWGQTVAGIARRER